MTPLKIAQGEWKPIKGFTNIFKVGGIYAAFNSIAHLKFYLYTAGTSPYNIGSFWLQCYNDKEKVLEDYLAGRPTKDIITEMVNLHIKNGDFTKLEENFACDIMYLLGDHYFDPMLEVIHAKYGAQKE